MFFGALSEKTNEAIKIFGIEPTTFSKMLKFIYTDVVVVNKWEDAALLYGAAKRYMIASLTSICIDYIKTELKVSNALKICEFAKFHEEKKLLEETLEIISDQTLLVFQSKDFAEIDISMMIFILEQNKLQATEMDLFNALVSLGKSQGVLKALPKPVSEPQTKDNNCNRINANNMEQISKFRTAIKKINFLSMTAEEFANGPSFCKLLLPEEALSIYTCLHNRSDNIIKSYYPKNFIQRKHLSNHLPHVFFDVNVDDFYLGRIVMELRSDIVPKTAENFRKLCIGENFNGFKGLSFSIFPNSCMGTAINFLTKKYLCNACVDPENFILKQNGPGTLLFPQWNLKKVFITSFIFTFEQQNHLNGIVFGKVIEGIAVLKKIQSFATNSGIPSKNVYITNCGEIHSF